MCTTGETSGSGAGVAMAAGIGVTVLAASAAAAVLNKVGDSVGHAMGDPVNGGGIPWALVFFVGGSMLLLGAVACWALIRIRRRNAARVAVPAAARSPLRAQVVRRETPLPAAPALTPPRGWPALPAGRPALTAGRPVRPATVLAPARRAQVR